MSADLAPELTAYAGRAVGPAERGPDPVNQPMIRHWCDAIGDRNPVYTDADSAAASTHRQIIAPPVMLQAWTMRGLRSRPATGGSEQDELLRLLDAHGFTSVVATNCEQEYFRDLHLGDHLSVQSVIESVSEEKKTALGVGHFVTTRQTFTDDAGDVVATMLFRILKFRPGEKRQEPAAGGESQPRPKRPRPAVTQDNAWWFEACRRHQLLIQRCQSCGMLRHPPQTMCGNCRSFEWDTVEASGRGSVYSFVVNHYPQVPAFDYPLAVGLIALEEGTRLVSDIIGIDPAAITVGMGVQVEFVDFDDELTLPLFTPRKA
jgi:uncharacterized OB-fold protein